MNKVASRICYYKELSRSHEMRRRMVSSFKDVVKASNFSTLSYNKNVEQKENIQVHAVMNEEYPSHVEKVAQKSLARVLSLFERYGNSEYTIGEPMTITEHSVQTAYAARDKGENEEAQLSCLLHDVGHLCGLEAHREPGMDGCGTEDHERVGAEFLGSLGFSPVVSYLALHHVNAKRYLCAVDPQYNDSLSPASKTTLKHQGGPMSKEEVAEVSASSS